VFSFVLAGAGISGARVIGSSDKLGGYPHDGKMEPQELTATIVHLLGIGHHATFPDATGRPMHVTTGKPIAALLGDRPASTERVRPTGNLALVPAYSKDYLLNGDFEEEDVPLTAIGSGKRLKGWQGTPLAETAKEGSLVFGVRLLKGAHAIPHAGQRHAAIGYGLTGPSVAGTIAHKSRAILTQELRNPRAGTYTISLHVCGGGKPNDYQAFLRDFTCRAVLFGYRDLAKDMTKGMREYTSLALRPAFADKRGGYQKVTLEYKLRSQDGGASEIERGVGLAVMVEKTSPGLLTVREGSRAFIRVDAVEVSFVPRPRNDDVTV
jgi:hypothetical protein